MKKLLTHLSFFAAALMVMGATVTASYADGMADIKARQALMKAIGSEMKAIGAIAKGQGDASKLAGHTNELAALAKKSAASFPAGSGPEAGETRAKANIWTDTANFAKVNAAFVSTTEALAAAGASGDLKAVGAAMGMVGKDGCGACHKTYRAKKS